MGWAAQLYGPTAKAVCSLFVGWVCRGGGDVALLTICVSDNLLLAWVFTRVFVESYEGSEEVGMVKGSCL